MSGKSKINIYNKMSEDELDIAIKEYSGDYRYYQRLIAMKLVSLGYSFSKVGRTLLVSYLSVHRWAKSCEELGLLGLMPNFGGGRPPKLDSSMEKKLIKRIDDEDQISMVDVQKILSNEFDVEFSLPHVCSIVRKLGFDYIENKDKSSIKTLKKLSNKN